MKQQRIYKNLLHQFEEIDGGKGRQYKCDCGYVHPYDPVNDTADVLFAVLDDGTEVILKTVESSQGRLTVELEG